MLIMENRTTDGQIKPGQIMLKKKTIKIIHIIVEYIDKRDYVKLLDFYNKKLFDQISEDDLRDVLKRCANSILATRDVKQCSKTLDFFTLLKIAYTYPELNDLVNDEYKLFS